MKCLTALEIDAWMKKHGHHVEPDLMPGISFFAPQRFQAIECLIECVLREVFVRGEILMVVSDTDLGHRRHIHIFEAFRRFAGETRGIKEAPGFLFPENEWQDIVTLFSLTVGFDWCCYLWGDHEQVTLFNWEGEIFDIWAGGEHGKNLTLNMLKNFKLERIERHGGENSPKRI